MLRAERLPASTVAVLTNEGWPLCWNSVDTCIGQRCGCDASSQCINGEKRSHEP
ncbi:hypothetical protein OAN61_00125 [bacterium]|nr:hypothetical protein [bacterium]